MARPRKVIDWETVDKLCAIQCTGEEIAAFLGISYDTLNRACQTEHKAGFADYFAQKAAPGKISLRRAQFQAATDDRNPTMMIWLGKQMLGQNDKQTVALGGADGLPPIKQEITADAAFAQLASLVGSVIPGAESGNGGADGLAKDGQG